MVRFVFFCVLLGFFASTVYAAVPRGVLTFANGTVLEVQLPLPELLPLEEVTDVCVIGTFITYDTPNFEITTLQMTYWNYPPVGDDGLFCWTGMFMAWSSARPIAHTVDTEAPFASLYDMRFLNSDEVVVEAGEGLSNITTPVESLLLRRSSVELFSEPNFSGQSFCIIDCGALICNYGQMHEIPGERPWDITQTRSARLGCSELDGPSVISQRLDNHDSTHGFTKLTI